MMATAMHPPTRDSHCSELRTQHYRDRAIRDSETSEIELRAGFVMQVSGRPSPGVAPIHTARISFVSMSTEPACTCQILGFRRPG